jgi:hypothetical protein
MPIRPDPDPQHWICPGTIISERLYKCDLQWFMMMYRIQARQVPQSKVELVPSRVADL